MRGFKIYVSNNSVIWDPSLTNSTLCYAEAGLGLPSLVQYIDCFVIGRYVTYRDLLPGMEEAVSYVELCEFEAYGNSIEFC